MKRLYIKYTGLANLHPDDVEIVDAGLVGTGTNKRPYHLTYIGYEDGFAVYEFGETTTSAEVNDEIELMRSEFPELIIEYNIFKKT